MIRIRPSPHLNVGVARGGTGGGGGQAVEKALAWLEGEEGQGATQEEVAAQQKELEAVAMPIMARLHEAAQVGLPPAMAWCWQCR
jgi:hypothetical protein